ncbi:MAG TPA: VWA domain-containing protein, partial [Nodularia sp. (in: cyanobacteria)]|nr:VWA domain-containing protein [Nodularia sp. (in: cyanobacteria)]
NELAEIKVLTSIISAHLKKESDIFVAGQLDEFKKHYLSKNVYINFPTTNEYTDIHEALVNGTLESKLSYKIDIGSQDILNLSKLPSANKFLSKMYRVYDKITGEIIIKPSFAIALNENLAVRHRLLSSRTKITKVDELMKPIFDDFLGLEQNGIVVSILKKVGADILAQLLQHKQAGKHISKEEMIVALTAANTKLEEYVENIYQDRISPLVFYIGCTGVLPEQMKVKPMTAEETAAKYPNLQFSKDEQQGTFFAVGDSIISIYTKTEYYSKKVAILNHS